MGKPGLWIVRRIIEAHGGLVWVSNPSQPTDISIILQDGSQDARLTVVLAVQEEGHNSYADTVLIIDDESLHAAFYDLALCRKGFVVIARRMSRRV